MESQPTKKRRTQTFKMEYSAEWPVLKPSKVSQNHVFCSACKLDISISHGGRDDCRRHVSSKKHKEYAQLQKAPRIGTFFQSSTSISADHEIIKAETLFTNFLVEHNIPLSAADHAGNLFKRMFPDSKIAKNYSCARTKSTAITREMSKQMQEKVCTEMDKPFSLSTDGSKNVSNCCSALE